MRKLRLDPEELRVESFDTDGRGEGRGTVLGLRADAFLADSPLASCVESCDDTICFSCDTCREPCRTEVCDPTETCDTVEIEARVR